MTFKLSPDSGESTGGERRKPVRSAPVVSPIDIERAVSRLESDRGPSRSGTPVLRCGLPSVRFLRQPGRTKHRHEARAPHAGRIRDEGSNVSKGVEHESIKTDGTGFGAVDRTHRVMDRFGRGSEHPATIRSAAHDEVFGTVRPAGYQSRWNGEQGRVHGGTSSARECGKELRKQGRQQGRHPDERRILLGRRPRGTGQRPNASVILSPSLTTAFGGFPEGGFLLEHFRLEKAAAPSRLVFGMKTAARDEPHPARR